MSTHAPGIAESPAEPQIAERHDGWIKRVPDDPSALWSFVTSLEERDFMDLLAHCVSQSVNAVQMKGSHPQPCGMPQRSPSPLIST